MTPIHTGYHTAGVELCTAPLGEDSGSLLSVSSGLGSPRAPVPFADSALNVFTEI